MTHNVEQHVHLPDPPERKSIKWPKLLRQRVKELWPTHTAREIVSTLEHEGIKRTRNSIISLVRRLKLTGKDKTQFHPMTRTAEAMAIQRLRVAFDKPNPPTNPEPEPVTLHCAEIIPLRKTLDDLDQATECHFIHGDHAPMFFYCARPIAQGSYCRVHYDLTHQQPSAPQLKPARRA